MTILSQPHITESIVRWYSNDMIELLNIVFLNRSFYYRTTEYVEELVKYLVTKPRALIKHKKDQILQPMCKNVYLLKRFIDANVSWKEFINIFTPYTFMYVYEKPSIQPMK